MNELALFAGAGGGILGGMLLGWRTVAAVEIEDYPRRVLLQRQADGILPRFPIWDDVCTFDGRPWRGKVDVISGGFPCQDMSSARTNNNINGVPRGLDGEKSGLWKEYKRIIGEVEPNMVYAENSPNLRTMGLVTVLKDFADMGYDVKWGVLGAGEVKAPHQRKRMWIVATNANRSQRKGGGLPCGGEEGYTDIGMGTWWQTEPEIHRVDDGVANRVDRLKAIGNGQVPAVAALAWEVLT